ncbi:MAG: nuoE [Thermoleophilia bacterium]|nr:nuoE [Thermoleophilia bacterium]
MTQNDTTTLVERIEAVAARYPSSKSAIIPALHLAQEAYGWLPAEAFEAVAEALDTTPAFAQSVATFYDMFHLQPVGKHLIEVCTNVACALNGAGGVLDEFEQQLNIHNGESTPDGQYTLRSVECLGGCGTAPTVAVNNRFREFFERSQVKPLLAELKATPTGWTEGEGQV